MYLEDSKQSENALHSKSAKSTHPNVRGPTSLLTVQVYCKVPPCLRSGKKEESIKYEIILFFVVWKKKTKLVRWLTNSQLETCRDYLLVCQPRYLRHLTHLLTRTPIKFVKPNGQFFQTEVPDKFVNQDTWLVCQTRLLTGLSNKTPG